MDPTRSVQYRSDGNRRDRPERALTTTHDVLRSLDGPVKFVANGGNAGDALINVGFYQLAADLGVHYTQVPRNSPGSIVDGDTVLVSGGGALTPDWPPTPEFLAQVIGRAGRIVVLPQSIHGLDELLRSLRPHDTLMCRERYSFEHCRRVGVSCELLLADDLALSVDPERLRSSAGDWRPPVTARNLVRRLAIARHRVRSSRRNSVGAWRTDLEAAENLDVPRRWIDDFSSICRFGSASAEASEYSARQFLSVIDGYDEIHTDRLHVIIGSVLLGKRVVAHPGTYWKIRGVVEQSLGAYADLTLVD